MIKVCIFNNSNDVSILEIFKKFFECINRIGEAVTDGSVVFNRLMFY